MSNFHSLICYLCVEDCEVLREVGFLEQLRSALHLVTLYTGVSLSCIALASIFSKQIAISRPVQFNSALTASLGLFVAIDSLSLNLFAAVETITIEFASEEPPAVIEFAHLVGSLLYMLAGTPGALLLLFLSGLTLSCLSGRPRSLVPARLAPILGGAAFVVFLIHAIMPTIFFGT